MNLTLRNLLSMVVRSIQSPREGASEVLSIGISRQSVWLIVVVVVALSAIFGQLIAMMALARGGGMPGGFLISPFMSAIVQLGILVLMGLAAFVVGRAMGGRGSFEEALLLMAWLQFIMICVQVIQLAVMLILPSLNSVIVLLSLVLFLWLLSNFVAELHGFKSLGQVFVMILVTAFAIAFFASLLLTALGVAVPIQATGGT